MPGWRLSSIIVALVALLIVMEMMRRRKLREKYAGAWLVVGAGVMLFGLVPDVAIRLSDVVGIQSPANLVFLLSGVVLLFVTLHLSSEVGHLEEEVRTAVEEIALLRCELEDTRRELIAKIESDSPVSS